MRAVGGGPTGTARPGSDLFINNAGTHAQFRLRRNRKGMITSFSTPGKDWNKQMEYNDNRGKKVVFLGKCLLNQNVRGFGYAVYRGAFAELIRVLLDNGIGIVQLPCPECLAFGGIERKKLYKFQPFTFNNFDRWFFPIAHFFGKITTLNSHKRVSRKEAIKAVREMEDNQKEGYEVLGVVLANDSPSCGVTKTIAFMDIVTKAASSGWTHDDLNKPDINKVRPFFEPILTDGAGEFGGSIREQIEQKKLGIKVIGWDIWKEPRDEAERVARELGLKPGKD